MRLAIFSWEYPPRIVGQLADYVKTLAAQMVKNNQDTWVVTYHDYLAGESKGSDGVRTYRVNNPVRTHIGVLTWVLTLNQEVERAAANIYYESGRLNLLDVHDWHFVPAAVTLKKALSIPFVFSIDSLEEHRSSGANSPFNMSIKSIEWLGTFEAEKLIVKSEWMRNEIARIFGTPSSKTTIVFPNSSTWISDIIKTYDIALEEGLGT